MLSLIDRYLLRQILATCLVMTGIGLTVLLLERVLYGAQVSLRNDGRIRVDTQYDNSGAACSVSPSIQLATSRWYLLDLRVTTTTGSVPITIR